MKHTILSTAISVLLFIAQLPANALATSYTTYEIGTYSGTVGGWGGTPDWQQTYLFSGDATIQDYPVRTEVSDDVFFTWKIESFSITLNDGSVYSGNGFIKLGTLYDYQVEDSYRFGEYRADTGYGPVDIAPHDFINNPFYKLPDLFGLWRPETYNTDLPDLLNLNNGIVFYNPSTTPVPEPSTLLMFGIGIAGFIGKRKFSKNQKHYLDITA
jgi:hypothetical protein